MEVAAVDRDWWKVWKNRRYILCLMVCMGLINMYATRINLRLVVGVCYSKCAQDFLFSIAIVAMTGTSKDKPVPDFDWTPQMKGYLLSSFFYSYALMQTPAGVIVKLVPPHIMYGVAVFVSALLTALMPLVATHFYVLIGFRILMGFFQAALIPCVAHFMSNWAPPLERSRMQSICISGAFIGTVLTMPIAGFVGDTFGWQWIFYVFAVSSLLWCAIWAVFIRSTPYSDAYISDNELEYITKSIGVDVETRKLPVPWASIFTSIPVWSIAIANFAWGWGFQTMLAQLPPFLKGKSLN